LTTTTKKTWRKKKKKKKTKRWLAHLLLEQAGVQQEAGVLVGVLLPLQLDALHHDLLLVVLMHLLLAWPIFRWQTLRSSLSTLTQPL
jgi:hypothetical protein